MTDDFHQAGVNKYGGGYHTAISTKKIPNTSVSRGTSTQRFFAVAPTGEIQLLYSQ
jgi:hypothetical protein